MSDKDSKIYLTIYRVFLIVGIVLLLGGITLVVFGSIRVNEFNSAHAEWYEKWWTQHTATLEEEPTILPALAFLIPGGFLIFFSLMMILIGLHPQFLKLRMKMHKGAIEYAKADIAGAYKSSLDTITPATKDFVNEIKKTDENKNSTQQ